MKKEKSPYMEIINRECKKDGKGRFKTLDVLRVSRRLYDEQQELINLIVTRTSKQNEENSNTNSSTLRKHTLPWKAACYVRWYSYDTTCV